MKTMKNALFIVLTVGMATAVLSQPTGKISGDVRDQNGNFLPGTNIVIENTERGAVADENGYFFILNVPPGNHNIQASMIGYHSQTIEDLKVVSGLTAKLNFELEEAVIGLEEVVVEVYRAPAVQRDMTFKTQTFSDVEIRDLPITDVSQIVEKLAGITRDIPTTPVASRPVFGQFSTVPSDEFHFRGGRSNETLYLFDGINVNDGIWGGFNLSTMGERSFQSLEMFSGTFGPQYGEAMSGVFNMASLSNLQTDYHFFLKGYTDNVGRNGGSQNTRSGEFRFSGPIPLLPKVSFVTSGKEFMTDGYIHGYIYPNYVDSRGADFSGKPKKAPMQYRDSRYLMGKVLWQPIGSLRISFGGFSTKAQEGVYNHFFKYNPYGTPRVYLDDVLGYINLNHVLTPSTFYSITLARYDRRFESYVYPDSSGNLVRPQYDTAEFSIAGEDWVYFKTRFRRQELKLDLSSQVNKTHKLGLGLTFDWLNTYLERRNPDGFSFIEHYDLRPRKLALYLTDKMEFEEIGMIINTGLRFDHVDPNREYVSDIRDPEGEISQVGPTQYISPRLGVSFPVSDIAAFHFGYGHYYQYPDFFKVYQGMNKNLPQYPRPDVRSVSGAIATGDIDEEKTVNYEAGVQVKVSEVIAMDVTGFYRKTSNLIGVRVVEDINQTRFPAFDNINFATVKGVELSLRKRFSNYFSGFLNYTYSQARVSSSFLFMIPRDLTRTFPADWDQPHVLSVNLAFEFPSRWGFDIYGSASSGLPYTFNQFEPNAERAPWISSLDILVFKDFKFLNFNQRIYAQIINLPDRRNIWWVYADSGKAGVDANPATSDDYTNDPTMWGPGRQILLGVSISG